MITKLRTLWKQAFGDSDAFLDDFFALAYSPDRCLFLEKDGRVAAMLYWFDCACRGEKLAYLYAIATDEAFRRQGLCRQLLEKAHGLLGEAGYAGTILVPGTPALFAFYEKLGYCTCSRINRIACDAGAPIPLRRIDTEEYAALRRQYLPADGVLQEDVALALLAAGARFYAGAGFVLAAYAEEGTLFVPELLGQADLPGITAALGADRGVFRTPGNDRPFAMYHPLSDAPAPGYFGLALD